MLIHSYLHTQTIWKKYNIQSNIIWYFVKTNILPKKHQMVYTQWLNSTESDREKSHWNQHEEKGMNDKFVWKSSNYHDLNL